MYLPLFFINSSIAQAISQSVLLWIIAAASIASLAIFFERLLFLRSCAGDTPLLLQKIKENLQAEKWRETLLSCDETGGVVSNVLRTGLVRFNQSPLRIQEAMELSGRIEIAKMERHAKLLSIVAHVAPLIGLLGTVLGFIEAFGQMRQSGLIDITTTRVGEAMEYALLTTAAGLMVAIPSTLAYNYLVNRISTMALEMELAAAQLLELIRHQHHQSKNLLTVEEEEYETI